MSESIMPRAKLFLEDKQNRGAIILWFVANVLVPPLFSFIMDVFSVRIVTGFTMGVSLFGIILIANLWGRHAFPRFHWLFLITFVLNIIFFLLIGRMTFVYAIQYIPLIVNEVIPSYMDYLFG